MTVFVLFAAAAVSVQPATTNDPATQSPAKASASLPKQEPHRPPNGYELVFSDEFNTDGLPDPEKWAYDTHRNKEGWYNNELQYYASERKENARVEGGILIIEARKETLDPAQFPDWGKQKYTSARLFTQGKAAWTYGFYEVRAKLPCQRGTWPAIWTLPEDPDVVWPNGGEIDIMEHVGFEPGVIHHSIHTKAFNFGRGTQQTTSHTLETACTNFHRYQLLWTPEFLLFGVDDAPKFLFKKKKTSVSRWPFDKPQHLLLNIAIGGDWGGRKGIDVDALPARMEIDHVRVYQLPASKD